MAKVITFSRRFPKGHPKHGRSTNFPEKIARSLGYDPGSDEYWALLHDLNPDKRFLVDRFILSLNSFIPEGDQKLHTIRSGTRWKQGEKASPRVWSGTPYRSPQIIIAPDVELKQVYDFQIKSKDRFILSDDRKAFIFGENSGKLSTIAKNDGLSKVDLFQWFEYPQQFDGQILAWRAVDYV